MSENDDNPDNPYTPPTLETVATPAAAIQMRKVTIDPISLLKRGRNLVGDQYWLFLGITLVGILVGSAVPFGIIMGPMIVGIYLCYLHRDQGGKVEFGTLFKGFDQFVDSLVAILILMGLTLLVVIPFYVIMFGMIIAMGGAGNNDVSIGFVIGLVLLYGLMMVVIIAITLPFIFTFQLIAEHKMKGIEAIKTSVRAVLLNKGGVVWFFVVIMLISMILTMMCYLPVFFFMPISFGATFLLYRDIFPREKETAIEHSDPPVSTPQD